MNFDPTDMKKRILRVAGTCLALLCLACSNGPTAEEKVGEILDRVSFAADYNALKKEVHEIGDEAIPALFTAATTDEPLKQMFITDALELFPPEKVKEQIGTHLASADDSHKATGLKVLSGSSLVNDFAHEIRTLMAHQDLSVKQSAYAASIDLPASDLKEEYTDGLTSSSAVIRLLSARKVAEMGDSRGLAVLSSALRDPDMQVVLFASNELTNLRSPAAKRVLEDYRDEAPDSIRPSIDLALESFGRR